MTDFRLTPELRVILERPDCRAWLDESVLSGAAPAWGADDLLCLRFNDDAEAEAFRKAWLES